MFFENEIEELQKISILKNKLLREQDKLQTTRVVMFSFIEEIENSEKETLMEKKICFLLEVNIFLPRESGAFYQLTLL